MSACKNHLLSFSHGIYKTENIAEILCQLYECSDSLNHKKISLESCIEELCNANSEEKKRDAVEVFLCMLAGLADLPDAQGLCEQLSDLCRHLHIEKKLIYFALAARTELTTLTTLLDHERPFLRGSKSICQALDTHYSDIYMELFVITVRKQQHWLELLLDELLSFIREENFVTVETFLSNAILQNLWPFLLLHTIAGQADLSSLKFAAEHTVKSEGCEPTIKVLAEELMKRLLVIFWVRENSSSELLNSISSEICFQSWSTLKLICQCGKISQLDWENTHKFLTNLSCDGGFADKWEIAVFDAFCASSLAFEYILACLHSKQINVERDNENLKKVEHILDNMQPVSARLRVMENIFSLLFIQYEDFEEDICSDSEEGEIDTNTSLQYEDSSKANKAYSILSSSLTSIANTVELNSEPVKEKVLLRDHSTQSRGNSKDKNESYHQKHGFVCDRFVARDILKLLQTCCNNIRELGVISFSEEETYSVYGCGFEVERRLQSLQNKVKTALWKLEILLGSNFIEQEATYTDTVVERNSFNPWLFQQCFADDSASDDESDCPVVPSSGSKRAEVEKSSESGSQSNLTSQGQQHVKRSLRTRRRSSARLCAKTSKDTIIKRMLSSKESLVSQCLSRGNFEAARKIVQALRLEDTELGAEVNFVEVYKTVKHKVCDSVEQSNRLQEPSSVPKTTPVFNSTLLAIQRAASAGVQASLLHSELEKLLSSQRLPRVRDVEYISGDFLQLFGGSSDDQPVVTAAVDIALILSSSIQQAANFLSIASKYSCELQNIQVAVASRTRPMGFLPLIQNILQVTVTEPISPSELMHNWDVPSFLTRSVKDTVQFWDSLMQLLGEMKSPTFYSHFFSKLLQLLSSHLSSKGPETKQVYHYLQDFKSYLNGLKAVRGQCPVTHAELPLEWQYKTLLQTSPHKMISSMVLEESVSPQAIESLVSQIGCNLPQILSLELCSSLSSAPPARPYFCLSASPQQGVHVLNASDVEGPANHPSRCVEMLLLSVHNELSYQLCLKQKLNESNDGFLLASLLNVKRMQSILARTWELRDLNLGVLQPGAETLAFFCNLANLMWIHCVLYLLITSNIGDLFLESIIAGDSIKCLSAMNALAYQVGTAGILTLWEVRRLALGAALMRPSGSKVLQQCTLTTDSFDPLALFVISTGSRLSPKLRVVYSENLEEQLQQSVQEYIQHWADIQAKEVIVPYLIQQYIESTGQNIRVFLKDNLNTSLTDINEEISDNFCVSYLSDNPTPLFVLEYGSKVQLDCPQKINANTSWKSNTNLSDSILQYIKSHSPVVSLILQELLKEPTVSKIDSELDEEAQEATELISATSSNEFLSLKQNSCLDRLCKGANIQTLSQMFGENMLLCALHSTVPPELLWNFINHLSKEQKWTTVVEVLTAIPRLQILNDPMLSVMLDLALFELAVECQDFIKSSLFCEQMTSVYFRAKCIISKSIHWPGNVCLIQLEKLFQFSELKSFPVLFSKAEKLKHSITIYQKVVEHCREAPWKSWQDVQSVSQKNPKLVLEQILYHQNAENCMSWIDLHNIARDQPYLINSEVVVLLLNDPEDRLKAVEELLRSIPLKKAKEICCEALEVLCRLPALQFCVKFLSTHCNSELSKSNKSNLSTVSIGIQMLKSVNATIQQECIELVRVPHLMIEQLIMNVQLEAAEKMLSAVEPQILKLSAKSPMSVPALDSLFRLYAEKALEFRISSSSTASQMSENSGLLASFSSNYGSKESPTPAVVPSKAEWVPNDQATICMNCRTTTFTMFNRRHHCRRCGRVVCALCSPYRSLVQGYGTLKVRICNSCRLSKISESDVTLTAEQLTAATDSNASVSLENVWRLSNSPTSNDTVRGEFAYEHAPSVSLCLSILKFHSKSAACPNFLIDSCEMILSYLQPQGGMPNPELDYGFVIEMCRSLNIAAKVKCAQWGYVSEEPNCDRRFSKIDLFGLLVSHGCTAIIPSETSAHGLRRLQSQLIESELWELALEVSTKSGMERIGVWTAWGKGCLKAGRWKEAREKFSHCFPATGRINKSAPDSPLLIDILQILENTPHFADQDVLRKAESALLTNNRLSRAPAIAVLNTLATLKSVSQGKFSEIQGASGSLQPIVYSECCYYLQEYGSHTTFLQFLVRHSDFKATVQHTLSRSVDPQVFFESVYMICLRRGQITPLHNAMTSEDVSLIAWTPYLHGICAALERRKLLHTLYEVQQWSKDHVRAAMTCIRFYHLNAKSYSQLSSNMNHLIRAQSHLEDALAVVSVSRKAALSGGSHSSSGDSTAEGCESISLLLSPKELDHHMSTIERQKELTKFLSVYEAEGHSLFDAARWFPHLFAEPLALGLPTLFGSLADRKLLAGLCLYCGKNVEEGYGIVYRIIEGFNLSASEIYQAVAIALFQSARVTDIAQLLDCIRSSGVADLSTVCDSVLMACVSELQHHPNASDIDFLSRNISDPNIKITVLIKCGQLKSAYLLAVKYNKTNDIELILQEAEKLGQEAIRKICLKRLGRSS